MNARTTVNDRSTEATDMMFSQLAFQKSDLEDMFPGNDDTADTIDPDEAIAYLATLNSK